jgi:Spy/CpxP family protein refolding chaperone
MSLKYLLAFAGAAVLTAAAQAQVINSPDAPQPGAPSPQAVIPSGRLYEPGALYHMDDVRKSLNLTPEQVNRLNTLTEQTQGQYRDKYSQLSTLKDADRAARMQELNRQYYGDWSKGARNVFNDEQRTRYQQLYYQYGGFNSLGDPDVAKRLNLTPEQRRNLNASIDWSSRQLQDINKTGATDHDKAVQMYRDYQKQYQDRFSKLLTPEQQKTWRDMTGEPYTFQPVLPPPK